MPHDAKGKRLEVGDTVQVVATVTQIQQTEDYCNITIKLSRLMKPADTETTFCLNAGQVEKLEKTEQSSR